MNWITIAGSVAAPCSMISFVPQVWRIVRSRDTGSKVHSRRFRALDPLRGRALIVTNSACLLLGPFILLMTLLPQAKKDAMADTVDPDA